MSEERWLCPVKGCGFVVQEPLTPEKIDRAMLHRASMHAGTDAPAKTQQVEFLHPHVLQVDIKGNFHRGLIWGACFGFGATLALLAVAVQLLAAWVVR